MENRTLRNRIDRLWEEFWTGGITNPLTVIEQISFLLFARLLDMTESRREKKAQRLGISDDDRLFSSSQQLLRWSQFRHMENPEAMLKLVRDEVFPHFRKVGGNGSAIGDYMKDAQLLIQKPRLLVQAVNMVDELPLSQGDTKGDLYEYLLSKLTTAGINGQFRTPRHIIRFMVEMVAPEPHEIIGDPACGTGGFLVETLAYVYRTHSSEEGTIEHLENGEKSYTYTGDLIPEEHREHIQRHMFHGFDFDATMLRTAAMNLLLHGIENPGIHYQDTLARSFAEGKHEHFSENVFDVILANPPFKGSIDVDGIDPTLYGQLKTKKTELLFVALILRMLKSGGRAASIVPDGVLFGSSRAHFELRKTLLDKHQLEAVISLPSGVFKPYATVSTGILVFTKGGRTDNVFFYDVQADGRSLDDKREKIDDNDLPLALDAWKMPKAQGTSALGDRRQKTFMVPAEEIRANRYDLSVNEYKEIAYEVPDYDPPRVVLKKLNALEKDLLRGLRELEKRLS